MLGTTFFFSNKPWDDPMMGIAMRHSALVVLLSGAVVMTSCKKRVELYCDPETPCADPTRPFCDLEGDYPASEGHGNTCIPDPFADADAAVRTQDLQVTVTGEGVVGSQPDGIDCREACGAAFAEGTEVTLTSAPDVDFGLAGWAGDCGGFDTTCTVTMDAMRSVQAEFAPHGSKRWVAHISFEGTDFSHADAAVDGSGHPILASTVDDGDGNDLYVAKHDRLTGDILWVNHLQTPSSEIYGGMAVDAGDSVYAAMTIRGTEAFTIGDTEVTPDLGGNIVVLRLADDTGEVEWVTQWGGSAQDRPTGVAVSESDLFVIGETSSSPADFDGISITASTGDAFLVRATTDDGSVLDVKHLDGNIDLTGVAAAGTRVAVAGTFRGDGTIDSSCFISSSGANAGDGFVADFVASDLDCQWAQDFGDSADDMDASARALAPYPGGGWVVTGGFEGNVFFATSGSGSSLSSRGGFDVFAVRYSGDGDHVWSFRYGDTGLDQGAAVAVTAEGNAVITGTFDSSIVFGAHELTGASDLFVTRMSAGDAPSHEWAVAVGGDDSDVSKGLAIDSNGYPYVLASFTGMTTVDGTPLTAIDYDGWLAALVR